MTLPTVGLIGTGIMGDPMVRNLLRAGTEVFVHNRTRMKANPLVSEGAQWCATPAALAKRVEVVITIVSDSPDVEAVYLDECGVCAGLRADALCVDMSTISPSTAKKVAERVQQCGAAFVDAPVSGGKTGAESGTLVFMVGGEAVDVQRATPLFDVLGKSYVHGGPVGNGQLLKLCNQILCGLNLLAVSEAVVFAKRVGLCPATMIEAVSGGAAGSWALNNLGPRMIAGDFDPMFMVDLQQKDLGIVLEAAASCDLPLPGTGLVSQLLRANQSAGEGKQGTQALVKTIERLANLR